MGQSSWEGMQITGAFLTIIGMVGALFVASRFGIENRKDCNWGWADGLFQCLLCCFCWDENRGRTLEEVILHPITATTSFFQINCCEANGTVSYLDSNNDDDNDRASSFSFSIYWQTLNPSTPPLPIATWETLAPSMEDQHLAHPIATPVVHHIKFCFLFLERGFPQFYSYGHHEGRCSTH